MWGLVVGQVSIQPLATLLYAIFNIPAMLDKWLIIKRQIHEYSKGIANRLML